MSVNGINTSSSHEPLFFFIVCLDLTIVNSTSGECRLVASHEMLAHFELTLLAMVNASCDNTPELGQ